MKAVGMNTVSRSRFVILPLRSVWRQGRVACLGFAGFALVGLLVACGGSSKPGDAQSAAGSAHETGGAGGGTAGGGTAGGNTDLGGTTSDSTTEAGQSGDTTTTPGGGAAIGGDGGAPASVEPTLGSPCEAPGTLACAGPHQKLTLVCSAGGQWETNQTCPSGQFCSSTPGPDLGICKAPEADCTARQPGSAFCASDVKTLMQCDADGIAATKLQKCDARCLDGACAAALPCPDNIVYSCDPSCPGPNTSPVCFNLCPTPPSGVSPLLDLDADVNGTKYAVALPTVAADSQPCSCSDAKSALKAVAFRLPILAKEQRWRLTYPASWTLHYYGDTEEESDDYKKCQLPWPFRTSSTPGCAVIADSAAPQQIWLSAASAVAEPGTLLIELIAKADATCVQ